jgi:hypothetical protein
MYLQRKARSHYVVNPELLVNAISRGKPFVMLMNDRASRSPTRSRTTYLVGRAFDGCWWCGFQVDSLNRLAQVVAAADQVAKVLARNLSLCLELACLLFLRLELLDVPLETDTDVVRRSFESSSNLRTDAQSVLVGVVDGC